MTKRPTCFVIANCTHRPIQAYLSATGLFSEVDSMALFSVKKDAFGEAFEKLKTYDYVFSIAHGRIWGSFEFTNLKAVFGNRAVTFATPFFTGLHPDLIYAANGQARAQSALLGDYHSGLVFWGFMTGRPVEEIIAMYHDAELPPIFALETAWQEAITELQARDRHVDIASAPIFDRMCREKAGMLTFNHPSMDIIAALCQGFCAKVFGGDVPAWADHGNIHHHLTGDVRIPVMPAVIRAYQLPYRSLPTYKCRPKPNAKDVYLPFDDFARLSYKDYAEQPRGALTASTPTGLAARLNAEIGRG